MTDDTWSTKDVMIKMTKMEIPRQQKILNAFKM